MIILGLDPGTARVGWGVIEQTSKQSMHCLAYNCIETDKLLPAAERLQAIGTKLEVLIKTYRPDLVAVERLFFSHNQTTAMRVSEARGVLLYVIEKANCRLFEITPQEVKLALTSYGRAEKIQVQKMVQQLLKLPQLPKPDDAADALAIAITAAQQANSPLRSG